MRLGAAVPIMVKEESSSHVEPLDEASALQADVVKSESGMDRFATVSARSMAVASPCAL